MKYFYCLVLILLSLARVSGQTTESIPEQLGQFFNAYSIINPASCGSKGSAEVELGRQGHSGIWKNIGVTYISGSLRIGPQRKKNNFQVLGLSFVRDKEGEYLKRSKLYLNYGWHTRLTKQLSLGAGVSAGFFSFLVSSSNASVAGSALAPDATLGLWLYHQRYHFGISANQILNSRLTPLQETTILQRHYNITGGYNYRLSQALTLHPKMMVRYAPGYPVNVDVAALGVVNEVISAGVNYQHHRSMACLFGLEKLKAGKGYLKCMFSYAFPAGKVARNRQTFELTLNYHHRSTQKKSAR